MVELILAVVAWRRGWRGYALLPVAFAITIGMAVTLAGAPLSAALPADVVATAVLGVMIARPRQSVQLAATKLFPIGQ